MQTKNVLDLLYLAKFYDTPGLAGKCKAYFDSSLSSLNALALSDAALRLR